MTSGSGSGGRICTISSEDRRAERRSRSASARSSACLGPARRGARGRRARTVGVSCCAWSWRQAGEVCTTRRSASPMRASARLRNGVLGWPPARRAHPHKPGREQADDDGQRNLPADSAVRLDVVAGEQHQEHGEGDGDDRRRSAPTSHRRAFGADLPQVIELGASRRGQRRQDGRQARATLPRVEDQAADDLVGANRCSARPTAPAARDPAARGTGADRSAGSARDGSRPARCLPWQGSPVPGWRGQ